MTDNLPDTNDGDSTAAAATYQNNDIVSASSGETDVKRFDAVDDSHPVAQATGSTDARKRQVDDEWLNEILGEQIYDESSAFAREFLQNSETACIRKCRLLLSKHDDYGLSFLTREVWYDAEADEELTEVNGKARQKILAEYNIGDNDLTKVRLPQKLERVIEAARDIGYDPTIDIDLYRDERKLVWVDNGIGMTFNELDGAYNFTGRSGSGIEGDTGGKWGMGALTFANLTGKESGMDLETRTCRDDAEDYDYDGIRVYCYLGGYNPLPGDLDPSFQGTRFSIPLLEESKGGVNMNAIQDWVRKYAKKLKVPVRYTEHQNGSTLVEEEYGGVKFHEEFNDPPVVIDRPGEFTAITGPNVKVGRMSHRTTRPDTWMVSMPIKRNTNAKVKSFWNVAIQIHDEQGRIIAGPNRGKYRTAVEQDGGLHDDDIVLPEPTADRDRLSKDSQQKAFFHYVSKQVQAAELDLVSEFTHEIADADHPAEAIMANSDDWGVFTKMVNYHGSNATKSVDSFADFVGDQAQFADWSDETIEQVKGMFDEVGHAPKSCYSPRLKKSRSEDTLGDLLADAAPEHTFVGCTINEDRHAVVYNTYDDAAVIACDKRSEYDTYQNVFGFKLLNNVPMSQSDDHEFDVPDSVHKAHTRSGSSSDEGGDSPSVEAVGERTLSIRSKTNNKKIDYRWTIEKTLEKLDDGSNISGHKRLIVFPRGGEHNVSDHYGMRKWAAIASVTSNEYDAMKNHPKVMTYDEFIAWSKNTVIATEEGGYTVTDLLDLDRHIVLCHADKPDRKLLLADENEDLRGYYARDMHDQPWWDTDDDGNELRDDPLFAVADDKTIERASYAFYSGSTRKTNLIGLKWGYHGSTNYNGIAWEKLDGSQKEYRLKAQTPKWDDDSGVYDLFGRYKTDDFTGAVLLGMHDVGLDPMQLDNESIRNLVGTIDDRTWNADSDWPVNHVVQNNGDD